MVLMLGEAGFSQEQIEKLADRFEEAGNLVPAIDEAVAAAMVVLEERYAEIFEAAPGQNKKMAG